MNEVNYPVPLWAGLPNSTATASTEDLRPRFGLTLPPWAVALVPNANIRTSFISKTDSCIHISVVLGLAVGTLPTPHI